MDKILLFFVLWCLVGCVKTDELKDADASGSTRRATDVLSNTQWKVIRISKLSDETENEKKEDTKNEDGTEKKGEGENDDKNQGEGENKSEGEGESGNNSSNEGENDNTEESGSSTTGSGGLMALGAENEEEKKSASNVDENSIIKFENNRIFFVIYKDQKLINGNVYKYRAPNSNEMFLYDLANISEIKYIFTLKNMASNQGVNFINKNTEEIYYVEQIK